MTQFGTEEQFDLEEGGLAGFLERLPLSLQELTVLAGATLILIGSLLRWRTIEYVDGEVLTTAGLDSFAGRVVLLAAIGIILFVLGIGRRWMSLVATPLLTIAMLWLIITWFMGLLDNDRGVLTSLLGLLAGLAFTAGVALVAYNAGSGSSRWVPGFLAAIALLIGLYNGLIADLEGLDGAITTSGIKTGVILVMFGGIIAFFARPRLD